MDELSSKYWQYIGILRRAPAPASIEILAVSQNSLGNRSPKCKNRSRRTFRRFFALSQHPWANLSVLWGLGVIWAIRIQDFVRRTWSRGPPKRVCWSPGAASLQVLEYIGGLAPSQPSKYWNILNLDRPSKYWNNVFNLSVEPYVERGEGGGTWNELT